MGLNFWDKGRIAEARRLLQVALATFEQLKMPRETETVRGILRRLPPGAE